MGLPKFIVWVKNPQNGTWKSTKEENSGRGGERISEKTGGVSENGKNAEKKSATDTCRGTTGRRGKKNKKVAKRERD